MGRKYKNELHACEIVLLAYYIASVNIESAYHFVKEKDYYSVTNETTEYEPFDGIVLTDTFQMTEDNSALIEDVFPQNSKRVNALRNTPLPVIFGNPPYSVGPKSANDNAQNQHYKILEDKIEETYAKCSNSTLSKSVYDSYVKAFRWATDRFDIKDEQKKIGERDGVIGFVTNAGWLDGNAMDGMRKCLEKEFAEIYVYNLRGNQRTSGELSRKEGGKVFGSGSRTPIAITILVKKAGFAGKAKIHYKEVEDYLTREQKLAECKEIKSVISKNFKSHNIIPNEYGD